MTNKYFWKIEKLQVAEDNLVTKVYWQVTATNDQNGLTAIASGIRSLTRGDSFTPYEQLTEQQVLDWCFAPEVVTVTDDDGNVTTTNTSLKDDGQAQVDNQIERQIAQKAAEPVLPWA